MFFPVNDPDLLGREPETDAANLPLDRRGGLERRRGERRLRPVIVLIERRNDARRDPTRRRRLHRSIDVENRVSGRSKLVHALLEAPMLDNSPRKPSENAQVTVKEGLVATVYSAWEKAEPAADGAQYRRFDGEHYRRVGSRLNDVTAYDSVEHAERAYEREYQRAYRMIYAEYPELRGVGQEIDGDVVRR